jgi:uncharacterized metal-binding protein YceD (DUF177 family)
MEQEQDYTLYFKELSEVKKNFEYSIEDDFLSKFDEKEILSANLLVLVSVEKKSSNINLDIELKGNIEVVCSRCLNAVLMPIATKDDYCLNLDDLTENVDFEIDKKNNSFNIQYAVYDMIRSQIPIKITHKDGECNAGVMKTLNMYLIDSEKIKNYQNDPRWDALKNINLI